MKPIWGNASLEKCWNSKLVRHHLLHIEITLDQVLIDFYVQLKTLKFYLIFTMNFTHIFNSRV